MYCYWQYLLPFGPGIYIYIHTYIYIYIYIHTHTYIYIHIIEKFFSPHSSCMVYGGGTHTCLCYESRNYWSKKTYIYIHTYIYIYTYTYIHIHIYIYIYIYIYSTSMYILVCVVCNCRLKHLISLFQNTQNLLWFHDSPLFEVVKLSMGMQVYRCPEIFSWKE